MSATLDTCRLKLARANLHLQTVDQEIEGFLKRKPQSFTVERDPETGDEFLWSHIRENPPEALSAIIGDFLHNLRSSLDHLAYQLVILGDKRDPSKSTYFPIFKTDPYAPTANREQRANWDSKTVGMRGVDIDLLRELQPYTRGSEYTNHPLFLLNEMTNWDKHRQLHIAAYGFNYSGITIDMQGLRSRKEFEVRPFAPLDYRSAAIPIARTHPEVEIKIEPATDVTFRDGAYWEFREVRETLVHLANFVADVVNEFEPRFRAEED